MLYLDTSLLIPYYCPETLSDKVQSVLLTRHLTISVLTEVEFYSALAKKVRLKELASEDASRVMTLFQSHLDIQSYKMISLDSSHYQLARNWLGQMKTSLRTLDALHLAIAVSADLPLATSDAGLAKAGKMLGAKIKWIQT